MVLAHAQRHEFQRPNPTRIAAMSGSVLVHLLGLALLMIPISMPTAPARPVRPQQLPMVVVDILPEAKPVPVELPPVPSPPRIERRPTPVATPAPVDTPTVIEAPSTIAVTPPESTAIGPTEPATPVDGPIEVGAVAPIVATAPRYPIPELRRGIEGTVMLRILIGTDGVPVRVDVERSSGSPNLDKAARDHVLKKWRFAPATQGGEAVQAWARLPVRFSLASG